jgi:hypothetical protein
VNSENVDKPNLSFFNKPNVAMVFWHKGIYQLLNLFQAERFKLSSVLPEADSFIITEF